MGYDRDSFLAGVAAGRNMESWPAFEGSGETLMLLCGQGVLRLTLSYVDGLFIDWGDGTSTTLTGSRSRYQTHETYSTDGDYYVTIIGNLKDIAFYWKYSSGSIFNRNSTALRAVLTPLPSTMSEITDCSLMFQYSAVKHVHPGLFSKLPNVTDFSGLFTMAPLKEIPETLFKWCTLARDFAYCFRGNGVLTEIPEKLFEHNPLAEDFSYCFSTCSEIANIPENLFANNPAATDFSYCFESAGPMDIIPGNLFANNTNARKFQSCFEYCGAKEIGAGLFYNNLLAEDFSACFLWADSIIYVGGNMFQAGGAANNFNAFMANCHQIGGYRPSAVPEVWTMYPNAAHVHAFYNVPMASNWNQIPSDWK